MLPTAKDILNKKKKKSVKEELPIAKKKKKKKAKIKINKLVKKDKAEVEKKAQEVLKIINKKFGPNTLVRASELDTADYGRLSTGNLAIDIAIGGGFKIGRVNSVSGVYSIGKSLLIYHTIALAQALGLVVMLEDVEGIFEPEWAALCGVDVGALLLCQPAGAEEALQIAIDCQKLDVDVVAIDSVEALEPTKEMDKEMEDSQQMAIKPKLLGEYLRKFTAFNNLRRREGRIPLTLLLVNQLREKPASYGDPEYEPGGRAIGFYSSIMLRLREGESIYLGNKVNKIIIGKRVRFKVQKNKTFRASQSGEYTIYFDKGGPVGPAQFDNAESAIVEGIRWRVITNGGSGNYSFGSYKVRGKEKLVALLRKDEDAVEFIKDSILEKLFGEGTNL